MMGAIVTFALFELVIGVRNEKKNLLLQLRSKDNATALSALERIRESGWDKDGTLAGANLIGADLHHANLRGANLQAANLSQATLQDSKLKEANMQGIDLEDANLINASLGEANLLNANMRYINLRSAFLGECNLNSANLYHANLEDADLVAANLENSVLYKANLLNAVLEHVSFNNHTVLPDSTNIGTMYNPIYDKYWSPETDMRRYTDPKHPDFWQPDWAKQQEKGE